MDNQVFQDIEKLSKLASGSQTVNESQRLSLLETAHSIVAQLEKPHERIMRMIYHEPALFMATKVLGDLGVLQMLAASTKESSAKDMARDVRADPQLVERLLKHIATAKFVEETGPDVYRANNITKCCAAPDAKGAIDDMYQSHAIVGAIPEFLKQTNYTNPIDKDKTPWKFAYKTDQHYFEYINTPGREAKLEAFRNHMDFKTVGLRWFEVPELMDALFSDARTGKDETLVIDIGGSGGQDIRAFHDAQSSRPGRLILQDLPTTIDSLDPKEFSEQGIQIMGHDFFTPQPVKRAKVYYLKMCLHDWPDVQCREILGQLRPAMEPGYSRIVLDEIIIPDQGARWFETSVDLLMMNVHSAQERREREWRAVVEGVPGLRVRKIWDLEGSFFKVIEIEAV